MNNSKAFYFTFYGAIALLVPFLTLYYQDQGLSGRQIGILTGLIPLVTLLSSGMWSALADATQKHKVVLFAAIGAAWVAVYCVTHAQTFYLLILSVIFYALCIAPIIPIVDNSVLARLGAEKHRYGRVRVWGSFGFGIFATIAGFIFEQAGLAWIFTSSLIVFAAVIIIVWRMRIQPAPLGGSYRMGLWQLMKNRAWILFLFVALAGGMSMSLFINFLFLYLETMGASGNILGFSLTLATISEIPVFLTADRFLKRWNAQLLVAIALLVFVIRAFAYVGMNAPWQVLPISLLHGLSFAVMWLAGVQYADDIAPAGLGATAQGIFGSVMMGLGPTLGAVIGGIVYDINPVAVFAWAGMLSLGALLLFVWANRQEFRQILARPV